MWTACAQGHGVTVFLMFLLPFCCANDSCNRNFITRGVTVPTGDIIIEYGTPLEVFCVLDTNVKEACDSSARDLVFQHNGKTVSSDFVTIVNSTTIRLYIEQPPASSSTYFCKLRSSPDDPDKLVPVSMNRVAIAYKPQEVQNFECISRNWENLTCTWKKPVNYVKTTYTLSLRLPGRTGRRTIFYCPDNLDIKEDKCYWDLSTVPHYALPYEFYYFNITGQNYLGTVVSNIIKFHHYAYVVPNPPENLSVVNTTHNSVCLSWKTPTVMNLFPPGINYKIKFQPVWYPHDQWDELNITNISTWTSKPIVNNIMLKYANTLYNIKVYGKSGAASANEDSWSIPASITVKTEPIG